MRYVCWFFRYIRRVVRRHFLNRTFGKKGINIRRAVIHGEDYSKLRFGENIFVADAFLDIHDTITIESNVGLGHQVKILTGSHDFTKIGKERAAIVSKPVIIKTGAWIASFSIILPGTVIGEHAVVAAGSVVGGKVPPYTLLAGNPAKPIFKVGVNCET